LIIISGKGKFKLVPDECWWAPSAGH